MKCTQCDAENGEDRKFCRTCGIAIGIKCDRCGVVNPLEDKYCGVCGFVLMDSGSQGSSASDPSEGPLQHRSGQYTSRDIEELMKLRTKVKQEEDSFESLRQDDINKLFRKGRS
jgi:hypothetical protein